MPEPSIQHPAPLTITLHYLRQHRLAPIPLPPGRKIPPRVKWKPYQSRSPAEAEVTQWWTEHPADGIAIVCGHRVGLLVVDVDPRNGGLKSLTGVHFPRGPVVLTPRGGWHHYFRLDGSEAVPTHINLLPGVDLKGEASFVVAPPTQVGKTGHYRWAPGRSLDELPLPRVPWWWLRPLLERRRRNYGNSPGGWQIRSVLRICSRSNGDGGGISHYLPPDALSFEAALDVLDGVKRRSATEATARCPIPAHKHGDASPSLSVGVGRDGRLLLHCFTGYRDTCTFMVILAALAGRLHERGHR
jgi:Bifunctional DNA primase/polymerase, N-terminal